MLVHHREQAQAAHEIGAALGLEVRLATPPGSVELMGVGFWRAVETLVGAPVTVDCGVRAGLVMEGLRAGLRSLVFQGRADLLAKLNDQAAQLGGTVLPALGPPIVTLRPGEPPGPALRAAALGRPPFAT